MPRSRLGTRSSSPSASRTPPTLQDLTQTQRQAYSSSFSAPQRPASPPAPSPVAPPPSAMRLPASSGGAVASPMYNAASQNAAADARYNAQLAAIQAALDNQMSNSQLRSTQFDQQYQDQLRQLGYKQGGGWNWSDQNTQAGSQRRGLTEDYASRGMLQSSGFGEATNDLLRNLNDRQSQLSQTNQQFRNQRAQDETDYRRQYDVQRQQAQAAALSRRAAGYAL